MRKHSVVPERADCEQDASFLIPHSSFFSPNPKPQTPVIIRSEIIGFCMGVRRAVEIARAAASENAGQAHTHEVITLGPLIHNPCVLDELKSLGIGICNAQSPDELPSDLHGVTVIIRAHGIAPLLEQAIAERGGRIIDATCPYVKKNQLMAQKFENAGVRLFVAGEAGHAEIAGISGYAPSCIIAGSPACAQAAARNLHLTEPKARTALIAQTTIDEQEYGLIGTGIKKYFPDTEIVNTICAETAKRQDSLRRLLEKVDAVIIAGGRESANTRRLAAIARDCGKPAALAESAAEIPSDYFSYAAIGLCAGASTPDSQIEEIERELEKQRIGEISV